MSTRPYKSGTSWCFWRWSEVPSNYIVRLHVLKTPWFAICIHWLNSPDPEPYLHDHPVSFLSIILHGWYKELHPTGTKFNKYYNYISAKTAHSITEVGSNTVTLCFMGPKIREWGFHTPTGWEYWKDYNRRVYAN